MATTGPQRILNGTYIGATNAVDDVRIYAQDTSLNIRQSICQHGIWSGGNASDVIANAKSGSPIAVCSGNGMGRIRVFYMNSNNILQEKSWDMNDESNDPIKQWVDGPLNAKALQALPDSDIAAFTTSDSTDTLLMTIYFQTPDNRIQEYMYLGLCAPTINIFHADFPRGEKSGWVPGHQFDPQLAGTRIAAFQQPPGNNHVYFQDTTGKVVEWVFNPTAPFAGWGPGIFITASNPPATPCALAAVRTVGFPGTQVFFRVYYQGNNNNIAEMSWDGVSWFLTSIVGTAANPNAQLAVAAWQGKTLAQTRIYFQDGKNGTAVAEYKRTDAEWVFQSSVPPLT